jgi:hypothetical protein
LAVVLGFYGLTDEVAQMVRILVELNGDGPAASLSAHDEFGGPMELRAQLTMGDYDYADHGFLEGRRWSVLA